MESERAKQTTRSKAKKRSWIVLSICAMVLALSILKIVSSVGLLTQYADATTGNNKREPIQRQRKQQHQQSPQATRDSMGAAPGNSSSSSVDSTPRTETNNDSRRIDTAAMLIADVSLSPSRRPATSTTPSPVSISMVRELETHNLTLSARQQQKVFSRGHLLTREFDKEKLFVPNTRKTAAIVLNQNFTYIHIFKSGGTTVEYQMMQALEKANNPTSRQPKDIQVALASVSSRQQQQTNNGDYYFFMTFVRDPLQHFLSGWSECGYRAMGIMKWRKDVLQNCNKNWKQQTNETKKVVHQELCALLSWTDLVRNNNNNNNNNITTPDDDASSSSRQEDNQQQKQGRDDDENSTSVRQQHNMDRMVMEWLEVTKMASRIPYANQKKECSLHSFPQANFLLQQDQKQEKVRLVGNILLMDKLVLVADLRELKEVLTKVVKLPYDDTIETGRNSSTVYEKQQYFPPRLDWLSNETIVALCDFVAIDYFLFDFDPPEVCRDVLAKYNNENM